MEKSIKKMQKGYKIKIKRQIQINGFSRNSSDCYGVYINID